MQQQGHAVLHQLLLAVHRLGFVPVLEHHGGQVQVGQHVAQAGRNQLAHFQLATKRGHGGVSTQAKGRTEPGQGLGIRPGSTVKRHIGLANTQCLGEGAGGVTEDQASMTKEGFVEGFDVVVILGRQLLEHIGMAANGALPEDHQTAGHDVCAFNGDGHRRTTVSNAQIVARTKGNGLAAVHIHGIGEDVTLELGQVVFKDGRRYRRLLAAVDHVGGVVHGGLGNVGLAGNASQGCLYAFHLGHRGIELAANAGKATRGAHRIGCSTGRTGRQGDATAHRQAFNQHAPALTGHFLATDDVIQRNEHILAFDRPVHKRRANGAMAATNLHPLSLPGNQRAGDAVILGVAQQAIRVKHPEGQAHYRGYRGQGDPAFFKIQANPQHFLAIDFLLAHDAGIRNGRGIGAGPGAGQAETGHFPAVRQPGQVVVFLFLSTVLDQQLTRAKRVGHAHGHHQHFVGRQLLQHGCLGLGRETQATVFLRNDHAEEFFLLQEIPQFFGQVSPLYRQVPGIAHGNRLGALVIHKGLFLIAQAGMTVDQQVMPVRATGEQLAVPAHSAGLQGHLFSVGNLRRHLLEHGEHPGGQPVHAELGQTGSGRGCRTQEQKQGQPAGGHKQGQHTHHQHHADSRLGTGFPAHHKQQAGQCYKKQNQSHRKISLSSMD